jgi:site-specific DNA recombinase
MAATLTETVVRKAAAYGRISSDPEDTREGVDWQLAQAAEHIDRRGWMHVDTFRDDDTSAWSGKARPGYAALVEEIQAGRVDTIVVRHVDRLWRDDLEAAQGRALLKATRVLVSEYTGCDYPAWTPMGQHMLRTMGGNAVLESDVKSARVLEAVVRRAEQGRMNGAAPYGWRREYDRAPSGRVLASRDVEDPEAAEVVRAITRAIIAGEPIVKITDDLNRRGVPAPGADRTFRKRTRAAGNEDGTRWSRSSVKKIATRASNAGLRSRPDGTLLRGDWPPLVSEDEWRRAVAILDGRAKGPRTTPGARVHLLTNGVGECGVCSAPLKAVMRGRWGAKYAETAKLTLVCQAKGCAGRREDRVDELVRAVVIDRLSRPDAADLLGDDGTALAEAEARVQGLRDGLAAVADRVIAETWTIEQADRYNAAKLPELAEAEAEVRRLRRASEPSVVAHWIGPAAEVADRWDAADVQRRRALLEALHMRVELLPTRRGPGFDPDSVRITYA